MIEYSEDLKSFLSYHDLAQVGGSQPEENKKLADLVLEEKPSIVIETGVFTGSSTVIILEALKQLGKGVLYSIDDLSAIKKWTGCYVTPDLKDRLIFIRDKSVDFFKVLSDDFLVDIFLHDSEHTYETMSSEYAFALKHIKSNGWILSHDVDQREAWKDFTEKIKNNIVESFQVKNLGGVRIKR